MQVHIYKMSKYSRFTVRSQISKSNGIKPCMYNVNTESTGKCMWFISSSVIKSMMLHIRPMVSTSQRFTETVIQRKRRFKVSRTEKPSLSLPDVDELWSLMATWRKDFLWHSVVHCGGNSLLLKVLLFLFSTSCRGWESLSMMLCSLCSILLSDTTAKESSSTPRTEPAFLTSLLSQLASSRPPSACWK